MAKGATCQIKAIASLWRTTPEFKPFGWLYRMMYKVDPTLRLVNAVFKCDSSIESYWAVPCEQLCSAICPSVSCTMDDLDFFSVL